MNELSATEYEGVKILYEDNHLLVTVKPQNMPTQADESGDPDLLSLMKKYVRESAGKPGEAYLGMVHRLDRPTGGIVVFAKTSKAASRLCASIADGDFERTYLAAVYDVPRDKRGVLVNYLKKDSRNNVRVVPETETGAKYAELAYSVLDVRGSISLLAVRPQTGRSHQIRVQLSHVRHPILGDLRYGGDRPRADCRLALWAAGLRFPHPVRDETMVFRVFPPEDEKPWIYFNIEPFMTVSARDAFSG